MRLRPAAWLIPLAAALIPPVFAAPAEPPRVAAARKHSQPALRAMFEKAGIGYPARGLLLRAFKSEGELELWAELAPGAAYIKLKTYPICARSGDIGPKLREGDGQVPEGFYRIVSFNPWSSYHLSMRVDYPNRSDRARAGGRLGGDIFIHGKCVTIGCIPMGDQAIEELYIAGIDAGKIDVHLFPGRDFTKLEKLRPDLIPFWRPLREAAARFESTRRLPAVSVGPDGTYRLH
jgi:murein L,D-transpeptidase YafK